MSSRMVGDWIEKEMAAHRPLRTEADFVRFLKWHAGVLHDVVPVAIMAWSSRSLDADLPRNQRGPDLAPLVAIRTLADMLQVEMDAGYLAQRDAEAAARVLFGSVWYFVFLGIVVGKASVADEDAFVAELARISFADLAPSRSGGPRASAKRARGRRRSG